MSENTIVATTADTITRDELAVVLNAASAPIAVHLPFDPTTHDGQVALFNAEADGESLSAWLEESGTDTIEVSGVTIQEAYTNDRVTGEKVPAAKTTFFTTDGRYLVSASKGIAMSAARLVRFFEACGDESVKIRFSEEKIGGGKTVKKFALVVEPVGFAE